MFNLQSKLFFTFRGAIEVLGMLFLDSKLEAQEKI